jgi:hypothetical protein
MWGKGGIEKMEENGQSVKDGQKHTCIRGLYTNLIDERLSEHGSLCAKLTWSMMN